jgi:biotin carboxyl carrier protein
MLQSLLGLPTLGHTLGPEGETAHVHVNKGSHGHKVYDQASDERSNNTRTDKITTSMTGPGCKLYQKNGDEVSAGDTTCDRSEAYRKSPHEDCGR